MLITDPTAFATRFPGQRPCDAPAFRGYTVSVTDLAHTSTLLRDHGFTVRTAASGESFVETRGTVVAFR